MGVAKNSQASSIVAKSKSVDVPGQKNKKVIICKEIVIQQRPFIGDKVHQHKWHVVISIEKNIITISKTETVRNRKHKQMKLHQAKKISNKEHNKNRV